MRVAFNIVALYAAWFATVLAAANDRPVVAVAASLIVVILNVALAQKWAAEIALIIEAAVIGVIVDASLINFGLAQYAAPGPIPWLPPLWLISIWMAFATSLNVSLAWLKQRLGVAAVLGMIVGPLSYLGGAKLGGMHFSDPVWLGLSVLALLWAAAFPLLLLLARRGDGASNSS